MPSVRRFKDVAKSLREAAEAEAAAAAARNSKPYHDPRAAMRRILEEIAAERTRHDEKWGGPKHDDEHACVDWARYIASHNDEAFYAGV